MSSNITTTYWLWKAKNKDPEAFAKVYDLYIDKIYRFIYFKVSDQDLAHDFSSEVFLKTWEYINTGKEIQNLNALLYATARNIVIDHYRRKSLQNVSLDEAVTNMEEALTVDDAHELVNNIDVQYLEKFLLELKEEYREVLILRFIEDFDISQIAQIMGKKSGAVRVLLHRATKSLKELLEAKQLTLDNK